MKPVIFYVDDQEENLFCFRELCPKDWAVYTYEKPADAIRELIEKNPCVILSDQKMPGGMRGFEFLAICKKLLPDAVRIIVTGYSDEGLVIASVRDAQIMDLIKKPWDENELLTRIKSAITHYQAITSGARLETELKANQKELKETNQKMAQLIQELTLARTREESVRKELESWVPPIIVKAIESGVPLETIKRDIASIAFDIQGSSKFLGIEFKGQPLRNHIIQVFTESIIRTGGRRESVSGDSCYGHFGLMSDHQHPADAALSAALDFRGSISNVSQMSGTPINIGISLHFTNESPVHIHTTYFRTDSGTAAQRSFDTSSYDVDLLHRVEKLVHVLPGTSIIMTSQFFNKLAVKPKGVVELGPVYINGIKNSVELMLMPSDETKAEHLDAFRNALGAQRSILAA
jgi:FixJ family two-component response regulator